MLAHCYQLWEDAWSGEDDKDDDIERRYVGITAVAKRNRHVPYEVFNELVAMSLGRLVGLPIPNGMVVAKGNNSYYASCHIMGAGGQMPPANLARFCQEQKSEACGVLLFDAWIANTDRHDENMWYDYYANKYFLIDHGRALLNGSGAIHMESNRERLGIRVDPPCLSEHVTTFSNFPFWYDRLKLIPECTIRSIATQAATVGVDSDLADQCADWLIRRRRVLPELFTAEKDLFPKLEQSLLDPFGDCHDCQPDFTI